MEVFAELSDEALAKRVQDKDEDALVELIGRYEPKLKRYVGRLLSNEHETEDIVQDVFVSAYRNILDFDTTRKFSPWIYRIAHNACMNAWRGHSRGMSGLDLEELDRLIPHHMHEESPVTQKEKEETRVLVEGVVDNLPSKYREIVQLYYFEDFSYKEIADVLHVPVGTVGIRLSRARTLLKKLLPPGIEQAL